MRELTFFTSNSTKLAHARYIAEDFPVVIKGFRQRTYHANYSEPRLSRREDLLRASYQSALAQCAKAGISTDAHPFILEDTSVKILALSSRDEEVPGLDIKYWMKGRTFQDLDASLRAQGNDRRATVRSDVLLHVPKALRSSWGVDAEYVVFVGEQSGSIVGAETKFETNLVYPWLDNKSFNKWFVPDRQPAPLGALSIDEADRSDFRRSSFEQLFSFLSERQYLLPADHQLELELNRRKNLVLAGYTCAGKTIASQHLATKYGYIHVEASDFMYLSYYYRHGYQGSISIGDFAEQALAQKPEIAAEKVAEYIGTSLDTPFVVSGFRSPEEVEFLSNALALVGRSCELIFVEADVQERYNRLKARMRPGDDISFEQFQDRDLQQRRMGLDEIALLSSATRLENRSSLDQYLKLVDSIGGGALEDDIVIREALSLAGGITEFKLEDSILIALLSAWIGDETRPFFSTTQISRMISATFPKAPAKHKDNVSRYFNQDFYAYYEIANDGAPSKRRYRLSNTGYGRAIRSLRRIKRSLG